MKVLYFAWVREKTGIAEETVAPPASVRTVADLVGWLKGRGGGFAEAFAEPAIVRAAVNQVHVPFAHPVKAGDEIAFFPPVTGGRQNNKSPAGGKTTKSPAGGGTSLPSASRKRA